MNRRKFLKDSSMGALAMTTIPFMPLPRGTEYSTEELIGQAKIDLFGIDINLRKEAYDAYIKMQRAAEKDGILIKMVSSFRNFERQKSIWERKYRLFTEADAMQPLDAILKIVEYSTIPGTSRHHWGTDIDIVDGSKNVEGDVLVPEKFSKEGPYGEFKAWMDENSRDFGYQLVYTDSYFRRGFKYEPWHYSYAPLSIPMLEQYRKLNLLRIISRLDIMGAEHFTRAFIREYIFNNIMDINPALL